MDLANTHAISILFYSGTLILLSTLFLITLLGMRAYEKYHKLKANYKELYEPLVCEIRASHLQTKYRNQLRLELTNRYLYAVVDLIRSTDASKFTDEDDYERWHFEAQKINTFLGGELKSLHMDLYSEHKTNLPLTDVIQGYIRNLKERTWSNVEPIITPSKKTVTSESLSALLKITELAYKANATTFEVSGDAIQLNGLDAKTASRIKGIAYAYDFDLQDENGNLIIQFNQPAFV